MAQGVVARCYDLQDAGGAGCGKSYRLSGLSNLSGVAAHRISIQWLGNVCGYQESPGKPSRCREWKSVKKATVRRLV